MLTLVFFLLVNPIQAQARFIESPENAYILRFIPNEKNEEDPAYCLYRAPINIAINTTTRQVSLSLAEPVNQFYISSKAFREKNNGVFQWIKSQLFEMPIEILEQDTSRRDSQADDLYLQLKSDLETIDELEHRIGMFISQIADEYEFYKMFKHFGQKKEAKETLELIKLLKSRREVSESDLKRVNDAVQKNKAILKNGLYDFSRGRITLEESTLIESQFLSLQNSKLGRCPLKPLEYVEEI